MSTRRGGCPSGWPTTSAIQLRHAVRLLRKTPGFHRNQRSRDALPSASAPTSRSSLSSTPSCFVHCRSRRRLRSGHACSTPIPRAGGASTMAASVTNYYERRGAHPGDFNASGVCTRRRGDRRRAGRHRTRNHRARRRRSSSPRLESDRRGGDVHRRGDRVSNGPRRDPERCVLAASASMHDPQAIGRRGPRATAPNVIVVGVLPARFSFLSSKAAVCILPLSSSAQDRLPARRHSGSSSHMIARLAPGVDDRRCSSRDRSPTTRASNRTDPEARQMAADAGFRSLVASRCARIT